MVLIIRKCETCGEEFEAGLAEKNCDRCQQEREREWPSAWKGRLFPLLMLVMMAGCATLPDDARVQPCFTDGKPGYQWWGKGWQTHCVPCEKAKSADERFVCFGEGKP